MRAAGLKRRPRHLSEVQALAAMGQATLMAMYEAECRKYDFRAAQLLLTADDLRSRERHLNAVNCIEALLTHDVLPIINENDRYPSASSNSATTTRSPRSSVP